MAPYSPIEELHGRLSLHGDLIDRMRAKIADLDRQAEQVSNLRSPRTDNDFGRTAALMEEALNVIIILKSKT